MSPARRTGARRIASVCAQYLPHLGGIETHVNEVTARLQHDGDEQVVITSRPGRLPPARETMGGVQVRRHRTFLPTTDFCLAPGILWDVVRGRWDLVHCQGVHTMSAPMAMIGSLLTRTPYVVTFHTGGHSSPARVRGRGLQWRVLGPLLRRADALIAVCEFERELFSASLGISPERIHVIRNGAELPPITTAPASTRTDPDSTNANADEPDEPDELRILSIGRLERYKGHQMLVEAVAALPPEVRARLFIVGTGPYEDELRALTAARGLGDRVQLLHFPPARRSELAALIQSADVVSLMSEYEAHPVAVMEALGLGRPVVVAATSGMVELAQLGWVTSVPLDATPEELGAALRSAAATGAPAITLPTWDGCAEAVATIYRSVLQPAPGLLAAGA